MAKTTKDVDTWSKKRKGSKEIRVRRISSTMHEHVQNVADHIGVSVTDFMKVKTLDYLTTVPPEYLKPFKKD
jgi:ribosome biogenesis protein Nip4